MLSLILAILLIVSCIVLGAVAMWKEAWRYQNPEKAAQEDAVYYGKRDEGRRKRIQAERIRDANKLSGR